MGYYAGDGFTVIPGHYRYAINQVGAVQSLRTGTLLQPKNKGYTLQTGGKNKSYTAVELAWRTYVGSIFAGEKVYPADGDWWNVTPVNLALKNRQSDRPRRLDPEAERFLIARVENGLSLVAAGEVFHIDLVQVVDVLKRHNERKFPTPTPPPARALKPGPAASSEPRPPQLGPVYYADSSFDQTPSDVPLWIRVRDKSRAQRDDHDQWIVDQRETGLHKKSLDRMATDSEFRLNQPL